MESVPDPLSGLALREPRRTMGPHQPDVFGDRHMRPDRVGLKNHADLPPLLRNVISRTGRKEGFAVENNIPCIGFLQSRDAAHQRGFPRTARSQQDEELFFADLKIDAIQGRYRLLTRLKVRAQLSDGNHSASSSRLLRPTIRYSKTAGNMKTRITRLAAAACLRLPPSHKPQTIIGNVMLFWLVTRTEAMVNSR